MNFKFNLVLFFCAAFLFSCSSEPPKPKLTLEEQIREDMVLAETLFRNFETKVTLVQDPETENYLRSIILKISSGKSELAHVPIQIYVYKERLKQIPRFFGFPGIRIYVPDQFLAKVEYENVLVAGLSLELSHVIHRHLARKVEGMPNPFLIPIFGEGSVFRATREERSQAINEAIELMYQSRYDPRGMVSFFQRHFGYNLDSETDSKELEFDLRTARMLQSERVPLADPVIRSETFLSIQKKWAKWQQK